MILQNTTLDNFFDLCLGAQSLKRAPQSYNMLFDFLEEFFGIGMRYDFQFKLEYKNTEELVKFLWQQEKYSQGLYLPDEDEELLVYAYSNASSLFYKHNNRRDYKTERLELQMFGIGTKPELNGTVSYEFTLPLNRNIVALSLAQRQYRSFVSDSFLELTQNGKILTFFESPESLKTKMEEFNKLYLKAFDFEKQGEPYKQELRLTHLVENNFYFSTDVSVFETVRNYHERELNFWFTYHFEKN
jgi:hypothetical protein